MAVCDNTRSGAQRKTMPRDAEMRKTVIKQGEQIPSSTINIHSIIKR